MSTVSHTQTHTQIIEHFVTRSYLLKNCWWD